jgi:hypothetical protein
MLSWTHFSPRLGFSFDPLGDGKTSIRGSWSRYNEYLMIQYIGIANPMYPNSGSWYWYDDNYNRIIEPTDTFVNQWYPPGAFDFDIESEVNLDATAPYTDEFTIGVEREVAKDFSVGATFVYKHKQNIFEDVNDFGLGADGAWQGYSEDSPLWLRFDFTDPGVDGLFGTDDDTPGYVYGEKAGAPGTHYYQTNVDGGFRKYWGINFVFNKRMSNNWQLLGSVVYSKAWGNIGGAYGESWGASGNFDSPNTWVFAGGRLDYDRPWNIKLQSTIILPYEFIISAYFQHRSGSPWARTVQVYIPDSDIYKYPGDYWTVRSELIGERRNSPVTTLDMRVEKRFRFGQSFSIGGYIDIINLMGRSGYDVSSNMGGYLDYSDPENPTFERWGSYGDISEAYGVRTIKVSLRFTF